MKTMYRPTISEKVEDLSIHLREIPVESLALSEMGAFDTPIVSAWQVCAEDGRELGLLIEYLDLPSTWSDERVKQPFRRTDPDHRDIPVPQSLRWVRLVPGSQPAFARGQEEALLLFDLDLQLARARHEPAEEPMNPTS